jgi:hypothetical protein
MQQNGKFIHSRIIQLQEYAQLIRLSPFTCVTTGSYHVKHDQNLKDQSKKSAATHLYRQYDYNRAPMAPPGTRIIADETPNLRYTWAPHGQDGWYVVQALEHY